MNTEERKSQILSCACGREFDILLIKGIAGEYPKCCPACSRVWRDHIDWDYGIDYMREVAALSSLIAEAVKA